MEDMQHPAHPGEVLREYLPAGLALGEMAKRLGVTRQALSALVNGRAGVSAGMALRLEAQLGTRAEFWLDLQMKYDLGEARKRPPTLPRAALEKSASSPAREPTAASIAGIPSMIDKLRPSIAALCARHGVRELGLFGSILRSDFDEACSDVDAAVTFGPPKSESLARQYFDFKRALEELLGRAVDLVEIDAMPDTRLKRIIERTQVPIYAAAA